MEFVINPGSGPVADASEAHAAANMRAFAADLGRPDAAIGRDEAADGGGRYGFVLGDGTQRVGVRMPGLPLGRVRYTGEAGQDIWDYPRLYVDGSSWVWCFALEAADDRLSGQAEGRAGTKMPRAIPSRAGDGPGRREGRR